MNKLTIVMFCCVPLACSCQTQNTYQVGHRESLRLRKSYEGWLAKRARKIDIMEVSQADLSKEAREAGFIAGSVDSETVMLSTRQSKNEAEGLFFGSPAASCVEAFKTLGITVTLEPTGVSQIYRFRLSAKRGPIGTRSPSLNPLLVRSPGESQR